MMKKKTAMIIGSPGPFSSFWRQMIAKKILPKLSLITNREPLSTAMLAYIGVKGCNIQTTACPSVLFKSASLESMKSSVDYSNIFQDERPIIGVIICGWNMPIGPFNRWPREDWEFDSFIKLISYLKYNTEYRICLMSHQNSTNIDGTLTKGNDHQILDRLIQLLGETYDGNRVFSLTGLYNAAQSKAIIGQFELLISGRIHGAVQGLSQCIPTVILDYGHGPKAHKLLGFGLIYEMASFVTDPKDTISMTNTIKRLITHKEEYRETLRSRLPAVINEAERNFELLSKL